MTKLSQRDEPATSTIDENSPVGTSIGQLRTSDPDRNQRFTYSLLTSAGKAVAHSLLLIAV